MTFNNRKIKFRVLINKRKKIMKKFLVAMMMFVISSSAAVAQNVKEPEYNGQVAILLEDSSLVVLQKEVAEMKTKTSGFGYIPIPGSSLLDKGKSFLQVKGNTSPNKVAQGKVTLVIRVKDNNEDPKNAIGVFQFETKKKERRYQLAEVGVLSGMKATTSFNTVDYEVKKWGTSSYLVAINDLQPGEYGVSTADLGNITTLSVK